jgi:hypothetical protein
MGSGRDRGWGNVWDSERDSEDGAALGLGRH